MAHVNIEIKARCSAPEAVREILRLAGAECRGTDCQTDTYYEVPAGRLKLRQGNIENALIYYRRPDQPGPKRADVSLYRTAPDSALAEVLSRALPVWMVVKKRREIYFLGNVKFHLDAVEGLGGFVEIEAIDADGSIGAERLRRQCESFMERFGIRPEDLVEGSYSDLLRAAEETGWRK